MNISATWLVWQGEVKNIAAVPEWIRRALHDHPPFELFPVRAWHECPRRILQEVRNRIGIVCAGDDVSQPNAPVEELGNHDSVVEIIGGLSVGGWEDRVQDLLATKNRKAGDVHPSVLHELFSKIGDLPN